MSIKLPLPSSLTEVSAAQMASLVSAGAATVAPSPRDREPSISHSPIPTPDGKSAEEAFSAYEQKYRRSMDDADAFWSEEASKHLTWFAPFSRVMDGSFAEGDMNWFSGGKLNACYNCVDRHIPLRANQVALIWEGDEPGVTRQVGG